MVIVTGLRGLSRVRRAVFDWLLRLSLRRLQGSQAGDLIYRATWDTYAFQTLFTQGVFTFLGALASVIAMTVVMWRLNGLLTLVALATVPLLLLVMQAFGGRMGRRAGEAQSADAGIATTVQQLVTCSSSKASPARRRRRNTSSGRRRIPSQRAGDSTGRRCCT